MQRLVPSTQRTGIANGKSGVNLFIVDTTFQLLNAIEAANHFGLSHNHLVIINEAGQTADAYKRIITEKDWENVTYLWLALDTDQCRFEFLGAHVAKLLHAGCTRVLHMRRMRMVSHFIRAVGNVNHLFLGHYRADKKGFMRHFANTIEHNSLFIVDDGTDVIEINNQRLASDNRNPDTRQAGIRPDVLLLPNLLNMLRQRYWQWDTREAPRINFFTMYDLNVTSDDCLVRNDYRHLRSLAGTNGKLDSTAFLGQCLVEDGYMDADVYLTYLQRVAQHFRGESVYYVPHPRESAQTTERVRDAVGFEVRRFEVPIEYQLVLGRERPRAIASFFCSALESCAALFGDSIEVKCFRIAPGDLKIERNSVERIYQYFERRVNPHFLVLNLDSLAQQGDPVVAAP